MSWRRVEYVESLKAVIIRVAFPADGVMLEKRGILKITLISKSLVYFIKPESQNDLIAPRIC